MKQDMLKRIVAIILLGSLLLGLIPMIALAAEADSSRNGTPSLGIIGGADGPTAILVSGNWGGFVAMTAAVLCAGVAVIVALKNRKKNG